MFICGWIWDKYLLHSRIQPYEQEELFINYCYFCSDQIEWFCLTFNFHLSFVSNQFFVLCHSSLLLNKTVSWRYYITTQFERVRDNDFKENVFVLLLLLLFNLCVCSYVNPLKYDNIFLWTRGLRMEWDLEQK